MSKLDLVIESCFENVNLVGSCIGVLASQMFDELHSYQIQTCVVEAVTNCIEHSYAGASDHTVTISYQIDPSKTVIDISDSGVTMDPRILEHISSDFYFDPSDIDNLPEGGWGLKIIKVWMDEVRYYNDNGINHFVLVKYAHQ